MRRLLAGTVIAALAGLGLAVVPVTTASAGDPILQVDLAGPVEPLTFRVAFPDDIDCDEGTFEILEAEANGTGVTPIAVVLDESDPNAGYVVLPSDTTPGEIMFEAGCLSGEFDWVGFGDRLWGALAVTKVVDGPAPADAAFVVNVACAESEGEMTGAEAYAGAAVAGLLDEWDVDLAFAAAGGIRYVYFDNESECVITEPVDGGATATTITPDEILNDEPAAYASTVTNTFAAAVEPTFTG